MKDWKQALKGQPKPNESREQTFKRVWNNLIFLKKTKLAFDFYIDFKSHEEPYFREEPPLKQLETYKQDLKAWGLIT